MLSEVAELQAKLDELKKRIAEKKAQKEQDAMSPREGVFVVGFSSMSPCILRACATCLPSPILARSQHLGLTQRAPVLQLRSAVSQLSCPLALRPLAHRLRTPLARERRA